MNQTEGVASTSVADPLRVVRIISKNRSSAGVLVRDEKLDASGETVSVIGCRSGIIGRHKGEAILIAFADGSIVPALITHIHAVHDRFRATIGIERLPAGLNIDSLGPPTIVGDNAAGVEVADPS